MIRVALFNRNLNDRAPSGVKTFLVEVIRRLALESDFSFSLIAFDADSAAHLAELFPAGRVRIVNLPWRLSSTRFLWLAGQRSLARAVGKHDVYWAGVPWPYGRLDAPLLVTLHDLFPVLPLEVGPAGWKRPAYRLMFRAGVTQSCRRAAFVVADSQASLDDLGTYFPGLRPPSLVVPLGVDLERWAAPPSLDAAQLRAKLAVEGDGPMLATVGPHLPHKNHAALIEAFADAVLPAHPGARLVIGGSSGPETSRLEALIEQRGLRRCVLLAGRLSFADMHALVSHADAFVFPSLIEGFGLPVLEAFSAGTPVVASTAGSLPEVSGEAALVYSPGDGATLRRHMLRILEDAPLRERLIAQGKERAASFSWEAATQRYAAVLRQVASGAELH